MASTSRDERNMNTSGSSSSNQPQQLSAAATSALATLSGNLDNKQKYIENYDFPYCDESSKYEKVAKIGQGTFGEVFKAREKKSQKRFVAMKKVLMDNEKEGVSDRQLLTNARDILLLNNSIFTVSNYGLT